MSVTNTDCWHSKMTLPIVPWRAIWIQLRTTTLEELNRVNGLSKLWGTINLNTLDTRGNAHAHTHTHTPALPAGIWYTLDILAPGPMTTCTRFQCCNGVSLVTHVTIETWQFYPPAICTSSSFFFVVVVLTVCIMCVQWTEVSL